MSASTLRAARAATRSPLDLSDERESETSSELERFHRHQAALFALARSNRDEPRTLDERFDEIVETAARTLEVERVGVWLFSEDRTQIEARSYFRLSAGELSRGATLQAADYPAYFKALETNRLIAAHHAATDPRTCEFAESYLRPNSISAMLDSPIVLEGRIMGVICHEHVGVARRWRIDEQVLAASFADVAALAMADWQRERADQEHRELERKMHEAQRLESVGFLTSKIAHDFNNLLLPISGWADLLLLNPADEDNIHEGAGVIKDAARRASALVKELLRYAEQGAPELERISLCESVQQIASLLRMLVPVIIDLQLDTCGQDLPVMGSRIQLQQIALNLVANSAHAIGENPGTIQVSWRQAGAPLSLPADLSEESQKALTSGPVALLEVRDDGCGMDEQTRRSVFTPFFTTKGSGHGLGLAAVAGIVEAHHGAITCRSTPGQGTTFSVYLPMAQ